MQDYLLKDIDHFDLIDFINRIERSFNIKLEDVAISKLHTVKDLCTYIVNSIDLDNRDDCTSQQAFYKLRTAISEAIQVDKKQIYPTSDLSQFIKKRDYRSVVKKIEGNLGFEINLFSPSLTISFISVGIFIISLFIGYFDWRLGLGGIIISVLGSWVSYKFTNKLSVDTVSDIVKIMIRNKYLKSRKNPNTFNKKELEKKLNTLFVEDYL